MKYSKKLFLGMACLVGVAAMAEVARANILDLSSAPCGASGVYESNPDYAVVHAFDNNAGTRWAAGDDYEKWIWVDLGADMQVNSVKFDYEWANPGDYTIRILSSADAANVSIPTAYDAIGTVTGRTGVNGGGGNWDDTFNFTAGSVSFDTGSATSASASTDAIGRFVMLDCTASPSWAISVWEVQVDASAAPVPEPSTLILMISGLLGLLCYAWRKRK